MNIINELKQKYNLAPDSYYTKSPYSMDLYGKTSPREIVLREKWKNYIEPKYYGFSLGGPTPAVWFDVIDEFLDFLKEKHPDFKILQIKLKMGSLRCYIENISPDTQKLVFDLENLLSDKFLVY
jgi:hypothetical protein